MKIVHVITRFIRGGADENTLLTCLAQARQGHEVTLVVGRDWHPQMCERLGTAVAFICLPSLVREINLLKDIQCLLQLRSLFRRLTPDVVHTHESKAGILGRFAAYAARVPVIVHSVHILPFLNVGKFAAFSYETLERMAGWTTNLFVYVSPGMMEECRVRGIGASAGHEVIESGIDVGRFVTPPPPHDESSLLAPPNEGGGKPFVLLSLAVLEKRKGHSKFLPVFRKIVTERPGTILLIAGDGNERPSLEAQTRDLTLERHVRFLGFRDDPESLLSIADVMIVCSEREGLPRAVVQAGIAGVPTVSTGLPGIERVVRHGETGFIVPIEDISAMKRAVVRLIDEPALLHRFRSGLAAVDFDAWSLKSTGTRMRGAYVAAISAHAKPIDAVCKK